MDGLWFSRLFGVFYFWCLLCCSCAGLIAIFFGLRCLCQHKFHHSVPQTSDCAVGYSSQTSYRSNRNKSQMGVIEHSPSWMGKSFVSTISAATFVPLFVGLEMENVLPRTFVEPMGLR